MITNLFMVQRETEKRDRKEKRKRRPKWKMAGAEWREEYLARMGKWREAPSTFDLDPRTSTMTTMWQKNMPPPSIDPIIPCDLE